MAEQQFRNTLYTHDNLYVLSGLNSESVDLIYLDPPFNSKRMYSAPIGSKAAGASFKDMWTWKDVDEYYLETLADNFPALANYILSVGAVHSKPMMAYLTICRSESSKCTESLKRPVRCICIAIRRRVII